MKKHLDETANSTSLWEVRRRVRCKRGDWWTIDWEFYDSHKPSCRDFWAALNDKLNREHGITIEIGGFMVNVGNRQEKQGAFRYYSPGTPKTELPSGVRYWGR